MRKDEALTLYRSMLLIRRFEERCAQVYVEGKIGGFLHLYIGQEAVAVGAMSLLRAHEISDAVEQQLRDAFPHAAIIIHADPAGIEEYVAFPPRAAAR